MYLHIFLLLAVQSCCYFDMNYLLIYQRRSTTKQWIANHFYFKENNTTEVNQSHMYCIIRCILFHFHTDWYVHVRKNITIEVIEGELRNNSELTKQKKFFST